jgi:hypothetical protein
MIKQNNLGNNQVVDKHYLTLTLQLNKELFISCSYQTNILNYSITLRYLLQLLDSSWMQVYVNMVLRNDI